LQLQRQHDYRDGVSRILMASPLNKTLSLTEREAAAPVPAIPDVPVSDISSGVYAGDVVRALDMLPRNYFDLIVADPPYNYGKDFGNESDRRSDADYREWIHEWIPKLLPVSKSTASFYI